MRWAPYVTLALFLTPIAAGVIFSLLPAFGWAVGLVDAEPASAIWARFLGWPGLRTSLIATVTSGLGATIVALFLAIAFTASFAHRRFYTRLTAIFLPVLAIPHAAFAIGFAFLVAPSGWLVRIISPSLTGWDLPPQFVTLQDQYGLSLMVGLIVKETPFLIIALMTAHSQVPAERHTRLSASLGYHSARAWLLTILPQVYPHIRLPLFAVLAYGLSNIDMALVLGPTNPPTLSIQALRWFNDAELSLRALGAAAALIQTVIVLAAIGLWLLGERAVKVLFAPAFAAGRRARWSTITQAIGNVTFLVLTTVLVLAVVILAIWSFTRRWRYPDALPSVWTTHNWVSRVESLIEPAINSLVIGLAATAIALLLAIVSLEARYRQRRPAITFTWVFYLPLLIPQIAFLFGVKLLAARLNWDGTYISVVWVHLLFVLPYVLLMLSDPFERFDLRYRQISASLGRGPLATLWCVHLPLILRPLLFAAALGFAVSISQYLATVLLGAGRTPTLTTEALALAAGGDRRLVGAFAFLQLLLPLLAFTGAALLGRRQRL